VSSERRLFRLNRASEVETASRMGASTVAERLVQPADGVAAHALYEVRISVHRLRD
jgi:hypothetical protein